MTEQLKAEAYVRSQRPALMELTFGCEVRTSTEGVYKLGNESYLQFWLDANKNGLPNGWTIIGHPIQLQDWLAALEDAKPGNSYVFQHGSLLYKPENKIVMDFNMDTGQPATESDYLAFNEITNV